MPYFNAYGHGTLPAKRYMATFAGTKELGGDSVAASCMHKVQFFSKMFVYTDRL